MNAQLREKQITNSFQPSITSIVKVILMLVVWYYISINIDFTWNYTQLLVVQGITDTLKQEEDSAMTRR